jgi:energy-coupling factor transport system permease protein
MRATTSGVLDRALDVAAALEVRGYGSARRPPRARTPYSRHDLAFSASAVAILAVSVAARVADLTPFHAYPTLYAPVPARELVVAGALLACALAPLADRRGIEP